MILKNLKINNFRNFTRQIIEFSAGLNLLWGENGEGKTNILEAIYLLSGKPSFRGGQDSDLKKIGETGYYLSGIFEEADGFSYQVEIGYQEQQGKKLKQQGKEVKRKVDLLLRVPLAIFYPGDIRLIQGEPALRRRYLDNLFLQASPGHRKTLVNYQRTLMQRNHLLKKLKERLVSPEALLPWNQELLKWGTELTNKRASLLAFIKEQLSQLYPRMSGSPATIEIKYLPSTVEEEKLSRLLEEEKRRGYTLLGPQLDDFELYLNGHCARLGSSQGEQKLLSLGLRWSEAWFLQEKLGSLIFLLDDALSSLDSKRKLLLLTEANKFSQVFLTHTDNLNHHFSSSFQIKESGVL